MARKDPLTPKQNKRKGFYFQNSKVWCVNQLTVGINRQVPLYQEVKCKLTVLHF